MFREKLRKIWVSMFATVMVFSGSSFSYAQESNNLKLNLKSEAAARASQAVESSPVFRVSLDSRFQNFNPKPYNDLTSIKTDSPFLKSNPEWDEIPILNDSRFDATGEKIRRSTKRTLGSTLTLTAGYVEEPKGWGAPKSKTFGAGTNGARWSIYGQVGQEQPFLVPIATAQQTGEIRAKMLSNVSEAFQPPNKADFSSSGDPKGMPQVINNYYLEAVYKFRPSIKGKVSYERSQFDSLEKNENVQVEGVVETGPNVMIKAGYRNQTTPEASDKSNQGDKKVWTEFILKF
ncbi:MAG: hypothetical protein HQM08_17535 [Candidatus Riflebacteria bacterium]|nr:hypothetical protein [Candidatus Riflebacteria bacterium]